MEARSAAIRDSGPALRAARSMRATDCGKFRSPALGARGGAARRAQVAADAARARPLGVAHLGVEPAGVLEVVEEERLGEIIPLRLADAGRGLQVGELLKGLDPFRHDAHAERM